MSVAWPKRVRVEQTTDTGRRATTPVPWPCRCVAARSLLRSPSDNACRRTGAHPHRIAVVAADCQHSALAQDLHHLEDVVRHHADDAGRRPSRGAAPMGPIARQIVFGPGIAADETTHFPSAPSRRTAIGDAARGIASICDRALVTKGIISICDLIFVVRKVVPMRNMRMLIMSTRGGGAHPTRDCRPQGRRYQKEDLKLHYALQRVGTAVNGRHGSMCLWGSGAFD